jgi:hypothetical protein
MFRECFTGEGTRRVPYLTCNLEFPEAPYLGTASANLLVDTGAETTILARRVAENIGLDHAILPDRGTSTGLAA